MKVTSASFVLPQQTQKSLPVVSSEEKISEVLRSRALRSHRILGHGTRLACAARLLVRLSLAQVLAERLLHDDTTVTDGASNSEIKHVFKVPQASGAERFPGATVTVRG